MATVVFSGILWDKLLKAGRPVALIGDITNGSTPPDPGTPPGIWGPPGPWIGWWVPGAPGAPGYTPPITPPTEPPTNPSEPKPPPPDGGWGWHPDYGWGWFPGGGGKPQPPR